MASSSSSVPFPTSQYPFAAPQPQPRPRPRPRPTLSPSASSTSSSSRIASNLSWFTTIRTLHVLFWFFALLTFAVGAIFTLLSLLWLFPSTTTSFITYSSLPSNQSATTATTNMDTPSIMPLILPRLDILSLLIMSLILLISFLASIPSIFSRKTGLLSLLNLALSFNVLLIIAGGGILWWRSLRTRMTFWHVWFNDNGGVGKAIEDAFECCGYFDPSEAILGSRSCPSAEVANGMRSCVEPFTEHAIYVLNGLSTAMFAMAGLMSAWIVVNACIVSERKLQERFRQIEEKHRHSTWVV